MESFAFFSAEQPTVPMATPQASGISWAPNKRRHACAAQGLSLLDLAVITHPHAEPPQTMASPSPLIKFDVCLYKKDEVSYEDFVEWATKVYPIKAKPLIQQYVVKWTQVSHPDCWILQFWGLVARLTGPTLA